MIGHSVSTLSRGRRRPADARRGEGVRTLESAEILWGAEAPLRTAFAPPAFAIDVEDGPAVFVEPHMVRLAAPLSPCGARHTVQTLLASRPGHKRIRESIWTTRWACVGTARRDERAWPRHDASVRDPMKSNVQTARRPRRGAGFFALLSTHGSTRRRLGVCDRRRAPRIRLE